MVATMPPIHLKLHSNMGALYCTSQLQSMKPTTFVANESYITPCKANTNTHH
jgi:hypothetical protein